MRDERLRSFNNAQTRRRSISKKPDVTQPKEPDEKQPITMDLAIPKPSASHKFGVTFEEVTGSGVITVVAPGTCFAAGVLRGDIIISINGRKPTSVENAAHLVGSAPAGSMLMEISRSPVPASAIAASLDGGADAVGGLAAAAGALLPWQQGRVREGPPVPPNPAVAVDVQMEPTSPMSRQDAALEKALRDAMPGWLTVWTERSTTTLRTAIAQAEAAAPPEGSTLFEALLAAKEVLRKAKPRGEVEEKARRETAAAAAAEQEELRRAAVEEQLRCVAVGARVSMASTQQPPQSQGFMVQLPPGAVAGQRMMLTSPITGQTMTVVVPPGVPPGGRFPVQGQGAVSQQL